MYCLMHADAWAQGTHVGTKDPSCRFQGQNTPAMAHSATKGLRHRQGVERFTMIQLHLLFPCPDGDLQ